MEIQKVAAEIKQMNLSRSLDAKPAPDRPYGPPSGILDYLVEQEVCAIERVFALREANERSEADGCFSQRVTEKRRRCNMLIQKNMDDQKKLEDAEKAIAKRYFFEAEEKSDLNQTMAWL